jgi:hypothetical protein
MRVVLGIHDPAGPVFSVKDNVDGITSSAGHVAPGVAGGVRLSLEAAIAQDHALHGD